MLHHGEEGHGEVAAVGLGVLEDGGPFEFEHQADEGVRVDFELAGDNNPLTHLRKVEKIIHPQILLPNTRQTPDWLRIHQILITRTQYSIQYPEHVTAQFLIDFV